MIRHATSLLRSSAMISTALLALAGCSPPDEVAVARRWLTQAQQAVSATALPKLAPDLPAQWPQPGAELHDPFRLQQAAAQLSAIVMQGDDADDENQNDTASTQEDPLPRLRLIGTLVRDDAALALLQINDQVRRVAPGDTLPELQIQIIAIQERQLQLHQHEQLVTLLLEAQAADEQHIDDAQRPSASVRQQATSSTSQPRQSRRTSLTQKATRP